jgi:hypothetical protein
LFWSLGRETSPIAARHGTLRQGEADMNAKPDQEGHSAFYSSDRLASLSDTIFGAVMALVGDQCALIVCKHALLFEKGIRFFTAGSAKRQSHGCWINASAGRLCAGLLAFRFLSHVAPKARPYGVLRHTPGWGQLRGFCSANSP